MWSCVYLIGEFSDITFLTAFFKDLISSPTCASSQFKWLYSVCEEVEYIPPQTGWTRPESQLSSDWIMHCGSTLLLLRLQEKKKKNVWGKRRVDGICPWCLLCQNVEPVFPCTQSGAVYQSCCDELWFVMSTLQMICDWSCLRAENMNTQQWKHAHPSLCFLLFLKQNLIFWNMILKTDMHAPKQWFDISISSHHDALWATLQHHNTSHS